MHNNDTIPSDLFKLTFAYEKFFQMCTLELREIDCLRLMFRCFTRSGSVLLELIRKIIQQEKNCGRQKIVSHRPTKQEFAPLNYSRLVNLKITFHAQYYAASIHWKDDDDDDDINKASENVLFSCENIIRFGTRENLFIRIFCTNHSFVIEWKREKNYTIWLPALVVKEKLIRKILKRAWNIFNAF
jgi:hypothetical protein